MLRARVQSLGQAGWSQRTIAQALRVSRGFVARWIRAPAEHLGVDGRGWPAGRPRRWDARIGARISGLHQRLTRDPRTFFTGATAVQLAYRHRYPRSPLPSLRTIGRVLQALGLSATRRPPRQRGAAAYLCYPRATLETLGARLLELDFIGPRYLAGATSPLTFVGFSAVQPPRLRYFYRVAGPTTTALLPVCTEFFARFERPTHLKLDNAPATIGSGSAPRTLSRCVRWLLTQEIEPVFAVPRQPFSQASIEGQNSVFARKFWRARTFPSLAAVDRQLAWFNRDSLRYSGYASPRPWTRGPFHPQVHFLRQVHDTPRHGPGIDVLHTFVPLPAAYTQLFVLATWSLTTEVLTISLEQNGHPELLRTLPFPMNPRSSPSP